MNKATRDGFGDQLAISAKDNQNILVLSADLAKATKMDKFAKEFPERFFEVGIAENNMIGMASGLSEHGYKVFLGSFAAFLTGKYDTIRCSLAYSNCPVILVGSHGGMAIGRDGVTQMGLEDIAIMRALPNMTVINPATYREAVEATKYLCETDIKGPHYLRLGRQPVEEIFDTYYVEGYRPQYSVCVNASDTAKILVVTTGCITPIVKKALEGIDVCIIHYPTLKPFRTDDFRFNFLKSFKHIVTVEDHSIIGGLGTIVSEVMAEKGVGIPLTRIGLKDIFPESGTPEDLYEKYGLSANQIRETIINIM
jgi:transketolase